MEANTAGDWRANALSLVRLLVASRRAIRSFHLPEQNHLPRGAGRGGLARLSSPPSGTLECRKDYARPNGGLTRLSSLCWPHLVEAALPEAPILLQYTTQFLCVHRI